MVRLVTSQEHQIEHQIGQYDSGPWVLFFKELKGQVPISRTDKAPSIISPNVIKAKAPMIICTLPMAIYSYS